MEETIHIFKPKEVSSFQIISFLLPVIIFILLAVVILSKTNSDNQRAAVTQESTAVLGTGTEETK